jgi:7-carboxy-7-deazaguanine synthase
VALQRCPPRLANCDKIVQDPVGHILVEDSLIAKLLQVELKTLELDTLLMWHVSKNQSTKIGLPRFWTDRCEFGTLNLNFIFSIRKTILEYFQLLLKGCAHRSEFSAKGLEKGSSMQAEAENRKGVEKQSGRLFRISEIYESVQGEGLLTGTPSVFVRTSGCNLRCWFCDTPFASWEPEGQHFKWQEVDQASRRFTASHVVLTGGEPLIFKAIPELCAALRIGPRHLTIETAGTIYLELECDLVSLSPKLASSAPQSRDSAWYRQHQARRERIEAVRRYMNDHAYQLKFVVDDEQDAADVLTYLDRLGSFDGDRVLLMPQGIDVETLNAKAEWLKPWCERHGLRFCPREHIAWFGNKRAT